MRAPVLFVLAFLTLSSSTVLAQCSTTAQVVQNRDGSVLKLTAKRCERAREQRWIAFFKDRSSGGYRTVLEIRQDIDETPTGGAVLRDLDGDGIHEVEVRGACGAGPNCEGSIHRLTPNRLTMFPFFTGGYAELIQRGSYLVESGRSSCCSWEHRVYRPRSAFTAVQSTDLLYRVVVGTLSGQEANDEVTCRFFDREKKITLPSTDDLLALCEVYGTDYVLAKP